MESDASGAPNEFSAPFDATLGLVYTDVSPDGLKAQLSVKPDLLQPMGIVHGGVWCAMVESMASVSAYVWLRENGGGNVVVIFSLKIQHELECRLKLPAKKWAQKSLISIFLYPH